MNTELPEEEKQKYSDSRCQVDVGRLQKAKSDQERVIIIKTIVNNFVIDCGHAIMFLEEISEWANILNMTLLLSYRVSDDEREEFCQKAMESRKICQFAEDKQKLEAFLDFQFKEKEKEKSKEPKIHDELEVDDRNKFKDI